MSPAPTTHVENRRLFESSAGTIKLENWERQHLHVCQVCQGVFFVFISQQISASIPPDEPSAAA
jgi:hypothetical protein